jgi:hypothetical protein
MTYNSYMEKNPMTDPKLTPPPELVPFLRFAGDAQEHFSEWRRFGKYSLCMGE